MPNCQVCRRAEQKYKCPKCLVSNCSLDCYKKHPCQPAFDKKDNNVPPFESDERHNIAGDDRTSTYPEKQHHHDDEITDDRVHPEKLELLGKDTGLRECLDNRHLRAIVSALDASTQPEREILRAMREPIFAEFVDNCLRVVEGAVDDIERVENRVG